MRLRIRAKYDGTRPRRCGNLACLSLLEWPWRGLVLTTADGRNEQLLCVLCREEAKYAVGQDGEGLCVVVVD